MPGLCEWMMIRSALICEARSGMATPGLPVNIATVHRQVPVLGHFAFVGTLLLVDGDDQRGSRNQFAQDSRKDGAVGPIRQNLAVLGAALDDGTLFPAIAGFIGNPSRNFLPAKPNGDENGAWQAKATAG